jgi:energy-coupling factor transport system permease protein
MRSMPVGQYLAVNSALHRLDPRARLLGYFFLLAAVTIAPRLEGIGLGLLILLVGLRVGRIPYRYALRGLVAPLPFLIILAGLQVFFNQHVLDSPLLLQIGSVRVTLADIVVGLKLLLRFFALILGLSLASYTLSTSEMTRGLNLILAPLARLKLPVQDFVMMVQITLRYLPLLAQTAERIAKGQASRGADWEAKGNLIARVRQTVPIIIPLFLASLRRAEQMALAMDARAYGSVQVRTTMVEFRFRRKDGLALGLALLLAIGVILI